MFELNVPSNMEKKFARFLIVGSIVIHFINCVVYADKQVDQQYRPDKLFTVRFDSSSQRLPPQIAYYVPDRNANKTYNSYREQLPSTYIWAPNNNNHQQSKTSQLPMESTRGTGKMIEGTQKYTFVENDPETAFQNFNYQIDFAKIPDKEPDFKRFESLNGERDTVKKEKSQKLINRPVSINYANTLPNIRSNLISIKIQHENKFGVSSTNQNPSTSGSDENLKNNQPKQKNVFSRPAKLRNSPYLSSYFSMNTLSHPTLKPLNVENESEFNFDSKHSTEIDNYGSRFPLQNNCSYSNLEMPERVEYTANHENHKTNLSSSHANDNDQDNGYGGVGNNYGDKDNKPSKGFAIYFTKITQHPTPIQNTRKPQIKTIQNDFVPSRIMSSVRSVKKVVHMPREFYEPTLKELIKESGAHTVYTEDGYEDKQFDHDIQDKSVEYLSRTRRSTNVKDLRGQDLIDHLDNLIRNVSDYLNSSEIIPDTNKKFPLYNSTNEEIQDSPIKYSEYAKPVVNEDFSSELYESKSENCGEIDDDIELSKEHNETNSPKKRLGNLGNKLDCLKKKLFGEEPLENPLFKENKIPQPQFDNVFGNIMQEADGIQTISSVYSDVMDNIKYNSFNENQRIFSDFGVSDNFAVGTINVNTATAKPENELNTNEKYPESKQKENSKEILTVTESPLTAFNPFRDPAQLPILDISKYIPTPKYQPTESDYVYQTDFKPIFAPHITNYKQPTTVVSTSTNAPISSQSSPLYGPVNTVRTPGSSPKKVPIRIPANVHNIQNSNVHRNAMQNILLFKHRRPIAMVRIVPNFSAPRS